MPGRPAGGTGTVFENDARADIIDGGWGVTVGLRGGADGVDVWNRLASQCFNGDETTCPSGQLAIELDGVIISAPDGQRAGRSAATCRSPAASPRGRPETWRGC